MQPSYWRVPSLFQFWWTFGPVMPFLYGEQVDEFMGALPETEIREFVDRYIPRESDNLVASANQLIQQGDIDAATKLIETARVSDPDNPRTIIAYARLKATLGEIDQAEEALSTLSMDQQDEPEVKGLRAQFLFDHVVLAAPETTQLRQILETDPDNSEALYQLAARKVMDGDHEQALDTLLQIMRKDRTYGDDAARKGMLALFEILGADHKLVKQYRNLMFNALH